jgi:hypothetical protein
VERYMKRILLILAVLALSVFLFSCQTAPEAAPEEEAPAEQPPEEEAAPLPDELRVRASELRDLVAEYELAQYSRDDWATAEEAFLAGEDAYGEDNEQAEELYRTAVENYENVVEVGVGELQSEWEADIEELNTQAGELKAQRAMPTAYEQARSTLEDARTAVDDEEYAVAVALYSESLEEHQSVVSQTREKRQRALQALDEVDSNIQSTESDIQELEQEQQTFDPAAEDLIEEES